MQSVKETSGTAGATTGPERRKLQNRSGWPSTCWEPNASCGCVGFGSVPTSVGVRAEPGGNVRCGYRRTSGSLGSMGTSPPLQGNFAYALYETARRGPDRMAIASGEGNCTYAELLIRASGVAGRLTRAGVRSGDRVAIFLPRGALAAGAFFGVLASGAVGVIVNESLKSRQIDHILEHSGARCFLSAPQMLERLPRPIDAQAAVLDVSTTLADAKEDPIPRIGTDVAQIIYTSGSTGLPKGVTLSHANLWAGMHAVVRYLSIHPDDRIGSLLPFSFDYGLNQLFCAVGTGATLVVERSPVPQRIVRTLREHEVTVLAAVPPLWLQLLSTDSFTREPLPALRVMTNSGGVLPTEAVRTLRSAHPDAQIVLMYGLTEAFRSTYLQPEKTDRKPSSIGRGIPGSEILVVRKDGAPCGSGEMGELVHRGPTVALGYWNDLEATAKVFRVEPPSAGWSAGCRTGGVQRRRGLSRRGWRPVLRW